MICGFAPSSESRLAIVADKLHEVVLGDFQVGACIGLTGCLQVLASVENLQVWIPPPVLSIECAGDGLVRCSWAKNRRASRLGGSRFPTAVWCAWRRFPRFRCPVDGWCFNAPLRLDEVAYDPMGVDLRHIHTHPFRKRVQLRGIAHQVSELS